MRYVLIPRHSASGDGGTGWEILDKQDAYTTVWRGTANKLPKAPRAVPRRAS